jgi:TatA/E family protein of Tat protein translocase
MQHEALLEGPVVSIGPMEIIIVLALALLVMGPSKLPQVGRSLGKGIREFKNAAETAKTELGLDEVLGEVNGVKDDITSSLGIDELKAGIDNVKTSMGVSEIAAGVGGIKTAIADPKKAAKDAVLGKPAKKKGKAEAGEAEPEEATPPAADQTVSVIEPADAGPVMDEEPVVDAEATTAVVGV